MIKIIPADEHYRKKQDWLDTTHHFSFMEYFDPNKMNFGQLRVFNDDAIEPGTGFGFHQHSDMEIVTYVISGILEHKDSLGNTGTISAGEVQRMSTGTGIMHSEYMVPRLIFLGCCRYGFFQKSEKPMSFLRNGLLSRKDQFRNAI